MELNRGDTTLVQSRNVGCPIASSHIPKTKATVHVARHGSEGIGTNVQTVCSRAVTEGRCLSIRISRNIPNFEGSICRAGEYRLFSSKEANACDLVSVSRQLV